MELEKCCWTGAAEAAGLGKCERFLAFAEFSLGGQRWHLAAVLAHDAKGDEIRTVLALSCLRAVSQRSIKLGIEWFDTAMNTLIEREGGLGRGEVALLRPEDAQGFTLSVVDGVRAQRARGNCFVCGEGRRLLSPTSKRQTAATQSFTGPDT